MTDKLTAEERVYLILREAFGNRLLTQQVKDLCIEQIKSAEKAAREGLYPIGTVTPEQKQGMVDTIARVQQEAFRAGQEDMRKRAAEKIEPRTCGDINCDHADCIKIRHQMAAILALPIKTGTEG